MARPRLAKTAQRVHRIPVRLTAQDAAILHARAKETHRSLSSYLRDIALNQSPRIRTDPHRDALIRALADIATTLRAVQESQGSNHNSMVTTVFAEVTSTLKTLAGPVLQAPISAATQRRLEADT